MLCYLAVSGCYFKGEKLDVAVALENNLFLACSMCDKLEG